MVSEQESRYRWYIISLAGLTAILAVAVPNMCMPVLFKEISEDLGLSLVQIGAVWGMTGLAGAITTLAGGLVGDKFGTRRTLIFTCIFAGVMGALRGFSTSFITLGLAMFMFGLLMRTITLNIHKVAGVWFSGKQVVIANGILATCMPLGFTAGAMISATVMSPALGSWRNVLFLYGAISICIGMLWILTKSDPAHELSLNHSQKTPLKQTLLIVLRSRRIWVFGVTHMCYMGCIVGFMGYLPIYLRNAGWAPVSADGALASFNAAGMLAAIPLTLLSRKLGSKKFIMVSALAIALVCVGLLSVFDNRIVWLLVIAFGFMRDGYVAVLMTMIMETEDIGINFSGTAIGLVLSFSGLGSFFAPPIGNSLAEFGPGMPFLFWACLLIIPLFMMRFIKDKGKS